MPLSRLLASLGLTVSLLATPAAAQLLLADELGENFTGNPGVLPPFSKSFGKTYGNWSAAWWQWAFSLPAGDHPLFDTSDCATSQEGKVWFLGGTFTGTPDPSDPNVLIGEADRTCAVPAGKALFFPIVNASCTTFDVAEGELRDCTNSLADHIQDLAVTIDGTPVEHLGLYRRESVVFNISPLPSDNILGATPGATGSAVSDGFWIMVKPLSPGEHEIRFEGEVAFTTAADGFDFTFSQDIRYSITVTP